MSHYLLATYSVDGKVTGAPDSPDEMNTFMERVINLETEMEEAGVFVFGGALETPDAAALAEVGKAIITDGPFAESKEHIAGFYIIEAPDDDGARDWARKTADATNHAIELRKVVSTGLVKDAANATG